MSIKTFKFGEDEQITTILKYHGKNRFYLSSDVVKALTDPEHELVKGDEMMIKILAVNVLAVNKLNGIGDKK